MRLTYWYLRRLNPFFFLAEIRIMIDRIVSSPSLLPHPNPSTEDMEAVWTTAYDLALKAKFGDRNFITQRKEKFEILMALVVKQLGTIASVCKTEAEAQSLGARVAKKSGRSAPSVPMQVKAIPTGIDNSIRFSWRGSSCQGAYAFSVEQTQHNPLEPDAAWKPVAPVAYTNRSNMVIPNLKHMEKYWFRVRAHFPGGVSPYSQPAMGVVL